MPEKNKIFIYAGPGASRVALAHTRHTLKNLLNVCYDIEDITPLTITHGEWEEKAALFVMPGGADLFYLKALSPQGNDKIRQYVEKGGAYLGICAGAYYAAEYVRFAANTPLEVVGERELQFFPGTVEGPLLAPYDYHSYSGSRIAQIHWTAADSPFAPSPPFSLFYNGGGYFVEAEAKPNTRVLATYKTASGLKPALIEISRGKGKVILSGVHWEYAPSLLDREDPCLRAIIPPLQSAYPQTLRLAQHLLERLDLVVYKKP